MTWAKLDDRFISDPQIVRLERDVRLVYVELLAYCAQHLTDGFIADYMLRRITDSPAPDAAALALVEAGLWEPASQGRDKGWQIVGYLDPKGLAQISREDARKARELSAETTKRSRLHKAGDHSECIKGRYCPQGQKEPVTRHDGRQSRSQSPSQSGPLEETRLDPTPREGQAGSRGATAPAPLGSQGRTPPAKPKLTATGFTITMPAPGATA